MTDRPQTHWLWVAEPRFTQDETYADEDRDDLAPGCEGEYWTCDEGTCEGDLALLYRTSPFSEVRWLFRATGPAKSIAHLPLAQKEGWEWGCPYEVLAVFDRTVSFAEMREAQQLARWDAVNQKLHGRGGVWPVPMPFWRQLVRRLCGRNPDTKPVFAASMRPPPDWLYADAGSTTS